MCVIPDIPNLWAVLQVPTVGHFVLPAYISWILPEQTHLIVCVSCVPQRVSQVLPRACSRLYSLTQTQRNTEK